METTSQITRPIVDVPTLPVRRRGRPKKVSGPTDKDPKLTAPIVKINTDTQFISFD